MDNIPVIRWSVVMERTDIGGFVSYHDYAMLYERIESMREDMQGRICIGKESSDEIDTLHARVAELEARIAELQPMAQCAAIMAVCGYFSRLRRPDAWLDHGSWDEYPELFACAGVDLRSFQHGTRFYAGSAPVPAAQAVDVDAICNAYESGVGHRGRPTANVNPYRECTPEHEAYAIGAKGEAAQAEEKVADDELRQAIARAYCNPMNASKIVDPDLIEAATAEVSNMLAAKAKGES